ncbi:MAG: ferrochelatase [Gammaproteobacteria bacterium]|nr:ferrochelatase [Gammaproteobacteria bacterium]
MLNPSIAKIQPEIQPNKIGVLLTNLGSPDAPTKSALRKYLKQFLSDKFVIEPPPSRFLWLCILHLVILNTRPAKSAKKYQKIWTDNTQKAPLISLCQKLLCKLKILQNIDNNEIEFSLGMRYGSPSIAMALDDLRVKKCTKIVVLPLYPQYSKTTTASTHFEVEKSLSNWKVKPELCFINDYHDNELYIEILASSIKAFQSVNGKPDKLLISYHSIPQRYVDNGDCYYQHCLTTTRLLVNKLQLNSDEYEFCFQSIFGREKWIGPDISTKLAGLALSGTPHVQVVCPGFPIDCLETLEEIEMENKDIFLNGGGAIFEYIPALNHTPEHVLVLTRIIQNQVAAFS